ASSGILLISQPEEPSHMRSPLPEDDGVVAVSDDPILRMCLHRPRENRALDICSSLLQIDVIEGVVDRRHVLLDDRTGIQLRRDIVSGRAYELDSPLPRLPIWGSPDEGRQERMVDIDDRHLQCLKERGRKDLHIAGENEEVRLPLDEVEDLRLGLGLVRAFRRNMVEGYAEETDFLLHIPMVRDHHGDLDVQLAPLMPPQQFEQAVIGLRREDDHVLRGSLVDEFPVEAEFGKRRGQVLFEAGKRLLEILDLEQEPLMESRLLPLAEELIALDDVSLVTCNKGADSGDDASALGSGHDQA